MWDQGSSADDITAGLASALGGKRTFRRTTQHAIKRHGAFHQTRALTELLSAGYGAVFLWTWLYLAP